MNRLKKDLSRKYKLTSAVLLSVCLSGCSLYRAKLPVPNYYYRNPDKPLSTVGRVAIVELNNNSSYPEISTDVTKTLFEAVQKRQVFGLNLIRQTDPNWRSLQMDLESTYNLEQLFMMQRTLKCDAILVGTITEYQPFPHMGIGLRLKLVDLKDGQLLWAFEQIWDVADKSTEYRIRRYFKDQIRAAYAPLSEELVTISPLKFIKFVAYEVAETL